MQQSVFRTLCLAVLVTLLTATVSQAADSIIGVWKVAEVVTTGANAGTNANPQPGLLFVTKSHYSISRVQSATPRPKFAPAANPAALTDAEKVARYEQWAPFQSNAGTYEIKGTTFTTRPILAKNQDIMGNPTVMEMKLEGDALWLITKSPAGAPPSETRVKWVRAE
ncbi:MAG: hypothetical protein AB7E79_07555 [Rhodospirillaceae bacterium]